MSQDEYYTAKVDSQTALRIFRELIEQGVYFAARPNPLNPNEVEVVVETQDAELVAPFLLAKK